MGKKKACRVALLVVTISLVFQLVAGDEVTRVWSNLYKRAGSYQQKYEIMLNIVDLESHDIIPTLIDALNELVQIRGELKKGDAEAINKLEFLIVKKLGDLEAKGASSLIFDVVQYSKDPYLKSEALMALGKIGAKKYAQHIAAMLKDLTLYRGENIQAEDTVAYGCVYALERFKDPIGYIPVFLAAHGGYSRVVKDFANKALVTMVDDPTDILDSYIQTESSFNLKLEALLAEDLSKAPSERKIEVATTALKVSLSVRPVDVREATTLRDIRIKALDMIIKSPVKSDKSVIYIEKILYSGKDESEKIYALQALGIIATDSAANALTDFLRYQNNRQDAGVVPKDNRVIIATIRALAATKNPVGYEELLRTKYAGYPAIVIREVDKALEKIKP